MVTSKSCPHLGQMICWWPVEGLAVLRTGKESPRGHFTKVISPAIVDLLVRQRLYSTNPTLITIEG
jgi:hypothetical protein